MSLFKDFQKLANPENVKQSQYFFKTGKGEYGEGDIFLGIRSPVIRSFAKEHADVKLTDMKKFIRSKYHEERLLGLVFLVNKYSKACNEEDKQFYYDFYLTQFPFVNNWDLVDVSCPYIVGKHLMDKDRAILYEWAVSEHLWTRRIAMISNWWLIRQGDLAEVFKLAKLLLNDDQDLIHKAVGWMLREAAQKDLKKAETFLKKHYKTMPRTMLRYAIEKFPEPKRQGYLKGAIC